MCGHVSVVLGGFLRAELLGHIWYMFVAPDGWIAVFNCFIEGCLPYSSLHPFKARSLTSSDTCAPTNLSTPKVLPALSRSPTPPPPGSPGLVWSPQSMPCTFWTFTARVFGLAFWSSFMRHNYFETYPHCSTHGWWRIPFCC